MQNQTEGELAVQAVNQAQWANVSAPTTQPPGTTVSTLLPVLTSPTSVFGDEAVASELLRQQQFRQQRAVPVASSACKRMLNANLDKVNPTDDLVDQPPPPLLCANCFLSSAVEFGA